MRKAVVVAAVGALSVVVFGTAPGPAAIADAANGKDKAECRGKFKSKARGKSKSVGDKDIPTLGAISTPVSRGTGVKKK